MPEVDVEQRVKRVRLEVAVIQKFCRARIPVVWGARRERCSSLEPTAGSLNDPESFRDARPTRQLI